MWKLPILHPHLHTTQRQCLNYWLVNQTRHSTDSSSPHHDFDDSSTALRIPQSQSSASHIDPSTSTQVPPVGAGPSTSFTTVNGPRPQLKSLINHVPTLLPISSQPQLASPPTTTSPTTNSFNHNELMVSIDVPLSSISRVLDSQRNSLIDRLRAQNTSLNKDNEKLRVDYETMQSKYNALEEQLRKTMSQMQEILEGKKLEEGVEIADWSGNDQVYARIFVFFLFDSPVFFISSTDLSVTRLMSL